MSNSLAQPRILFVIPEVAFIPEGKKSRQIFIGARTGGFGDYLAELINDLIHLGVDVHVAQPDYRRVFAILAQDEQISTGIELSNHRVHLAEDRSLFYSKPINSNPEYENIKISLAFQREVINQIIPRVQPDLIHCYDWMTGLIPAAARFFKISCLFTAQQLDTARSSLSYVEDRGIDAAVFWQHLFYDRYPLNYEETRETNPVDFLLSGVFAANFVTTSRLAFLANGCRDHSRFAKFPLWQVLAKKIESGCVTVNQHIAKTEQYIEKYEKLLQQGTLAAKRNGFNVLNVRSYK
jgi:starch synthase